MAIFTWIISALWLVFLAYWVISAIGVKRSVEATAWWKQSALRLSLLVLVIIIALYVPEARRALRLMQLHELHGALMGAIGTVLVGLGLGLATCARAYLGPNWGSPMSRKENPDLVMSGPYAVVRHPIYAGILLAMLGSAVGQSTIWVFALIFFGPYFIYSAKREEEFMSRKFGDNYRAYMRRTKMLVPFVL